MHPIAVYRRAQGMTQDDLAKVVGVSTNSVQGWEKGSGPRARYIPRLAQLFGVDNAELVREIDAWRTAHPKVAA